MKLRKSKIGLETLKEQLWILHDVILIHIKFSTEYSCFIRFGMYLPKSRFSFFTISTSVRFGRYDRYRSRLPPSAFRNCQLLPPATKLGQGYVFTGVCDSVHRGVSASVHAEIPLPLEQTLPRADTPWEQTPPWSRHPLGADIPQEQTPPWEQTSPQCRASWEIWSMCGWYASYWNTILFNEVCTF